MNSTKQQIKKVLKSVVPVETLEHTENTESFKIDQHTVGNLIPEDQCDES